MQFRPPRMSARRVPGASNPNWLIPMPGGHSFVSLSERTISPELVVVEPIRLMTVVRPYTGLPNQFRLVKGNSLCPILFNLIVQDCCWHTPVWTPSSRASFCSSTTQD